MAGDKPLSIVDNKELVKINGKYLYMKSNRYTIKI
ncbi:Uncharacterised protein [Streptococcus parasanguinis]|nr:Uncharacterised protein [Streptococcus parasanguinis]